MAQPRLILADDHTMVVEALKHLLEPEFDIIATVSDGRALVKSAAELKPDVVVVDIGMPLLNGLDAGQQLKAACPDIKVIYLTQHRDARYVAEAFKRHASGFLPKSSAASELTIAIREALQGRSYLSPLIAKELPQGMGEPRATEGGGPRDLSPREREVLQLLAEGKSMKEVATVLDISPRTVEFHKYRIMEVLNIKSSAELVQYAIKEGLVVP
jgi:DNA-binding NarL/FixJ family response regulator